MAASRLSLADRFDLSRSRVILSGQQAIVRLMLMQKARDEAAGLDTGGFISGYRGSPLGTLDMHFQRAGDLLKPRDILFQPGINEELAATAIWGAQQAGIRGEGRKDGVFCVWYGKGPGVDRCGDVFRHANSAGSAQHGGVLVLMGDDHAAESSTVPHQSEFTLIDAMMPILNPAGVQEILDYGVLGLALSRYSGCWVGLKCLHDNIESTAVVDGAPDRIGIRLPDDFDMPPGGLNIREPDDRFSMERRLHRHKPLAAQAFARANALDRIVWNGGKSPALGVVASGKSWMDVRQALEELGMDEAAAEKAGLRLLKIGMIWPLEPQIVRRFAEGLETILVVEEKRSILETQIREQLFNLPARPRVIGKRDERGGELFPAHGVLEPLAVARAIARRLPRRDVLPPERLKALEETMRRAEAPAGGLPATPERTPWFCAGCPHNASTILPEGARGYAGIGCHWLVQLMPGRNTRGSTQMGAEGANWIGEAPFSRRRHIFQNMGDGTFVHSGLLAIRACRAAGVNITFKLLFNGAVAMTGGQPMDGGLSVPQAAFQARAEGVERIAVVTRERGRWSGEPFPPGTTFHTRDELKELQKELMDVPGVSLLIHDQPCATEIRRRRRRGLLPPPARRVFINEAVCDGCGDCGAKSNCVAVVPVETPWGRKRRIDQSVCNHDMLCLEGLCPAMTTVEGASPRRPAPAREKAPPPAPAPTPPALERPWSMVIAGIGGSGVVTVGQILGQAAHIDGLGAGLIDMSGIAQKNGAVFTHLKIARRPEDIAAIRIAAGGADCILGCDLMVAASDRILRMAAPGRTRAIVNAHEVMPAQFLHDPDLRLPADAMKARLRAAIGAENLLLLHASELAAALPGDAIFANIFVLGAAFQQGLIPLSREALEEAIRLNGAAVEENIAAFRWGRAFVHDEAAVRRAAGMEETPEGTEETLEDIIAQGESLLRDWQNGACARRYREFIERTRQTEERKAGSDALTRVVARQLARLTAVKDEYEVARLYASPAFRERVRREFGPRARVRPHLAPPLLSSRKRAWPSWTLRLMPALARMKILRGTALDIFGKTQERIRERAAAKEYQALIERLLAGLTRENHSRAVEIAALAEKIRGFGSVRREATEAYEAAVRRRLKDWPG